MTLTQRLIAFGLAASVASGGAYIASHEGLVLGTYVDPVGIVTSCFGYTGNDIQLGQTFTEDQCLEQLATDLSKFNVDLIRMTPPLTAGEHAAYLSFTYNVGAQAFYQSTLRKKLLAGDRLGACHELTRWVYADGRKLQGLVNRRADEMALCLRDL